MPEKDHETLKRDSRERVDRVHLHVQQVLAGKIPEDAPVGFVLTPEMEASGRPWWWGPDYKPTQQQLDAVAKQAVEDAERCGKEEPEPPEE